MSAQPGRPRALAVDDEPLVCELVVRALENAGWEVEVADDGVAALAKIAARRPDVVLLDVRMPGIGGLEVLERLRRDARPPAVVALTALGDYDTFAGLVRGGRRRLPAEALLAGRPRRPVRPPAARHPPAPAGARRAAA
jgi:CheY-like chemotaxis protein